jgi:hypothetical protein
MAALKSKVEDDDDEVLCIRSMDWIEMALEETCARAFCRLPSLLQRTIGSGVHSYYCS